VLCPPPSSAIRLCILRYLERRNHAYYPPLASFHSSFLLDQRVTTRPLSLLVPLPSILFQLVGCNKAGSVTLYFSEATRLKSEGGLRANLAASNAAPHSVLPFHCPSLSLLPLVPFASPLHHITLFSSPCTNTLHRYTRLFPLYPASLFFHHTSDTHISYTPLSI
jgi:hypothetical protein